MVQKYSEKATSPKRKEKKKKNEKGRRHSSGNETKQNNRNTRERQHDIRPVDISSRQHEPACFGLSSPWSFPPSSGILLHEAIHFVMKRSAPCSAILRHSPSSRAAVVHTLLVDVDTVGYEVVQETLHPLFFLAPHAARAHRTNNSPNITHFCTLVSSMRATNNPANKIRLLRKVISMLSLPVLISVSR